MKKVIVFAVLYCIVAVLFHSIVAEDWMQESREVTAVTPGTPIRVEAGHEVVQTFTGTMDQIEELTVFFAAETENASVSLTVKRDGETLWTKVVGAADIVNYQNTAIPVEPAVSDAQGKTHTLHITGETGVMVTYAGDSVSAGKFDVNVESAEQLRLDDTQLAGQLVLGMAGVNLITAYLYIIPVAVVGGIAMILALLYLSTAKGQNGKIGRTLRTFKQYKFLLRQLVMRDFKVKYKSSALGVMWSFLNPLFTMLVYYFVFSTIFQNNIENFPAYLITGIIVFNYFSESTSLGMSSIVGNGGLITKVYIPKYIFPLSKILSSAINLCISMIPMLVIILLVGIPLQESMLLLPLAVFYLMTFSLGLSLMLATLNTFFRDTQFLWSVLLTMWNFLTPIFYPASIIPAKYQPIYQMNPMYQIVGFVRSIMIDGVSPSPAAYLYCTVASVVSMALGLYIFRKKQNQFVLHL